MPQTVVYCEHDRDFDSDSHEWGCCCTGLGQSKHAEQKFALTPHHTPHQGLLSHRTTRRSSDCSHTQLGRSHTPYEALDRNAYLLERFRLRLLLDSDILDL